MQIHVVPIPALLTLEHLVDRSVVVFDVLRATTTITAALAAGVGEVRIFGDINTASLAAKSYGTGALLCGEVKCLAPTGFDLGNSPGAFERGAHGDRIAFLSTTNGTKAIIAAHGAAMILAGALTNAAAVARHLVEAGRTVTLLCAGTSGQLAMEDMLGTGAVFDAITQMTTARPADDFALMALTLFRGAKANLPAVLRQTTGGRNILAAGLEPDIDFCANLNSTEIVGIIHNDPLRVIAYANPA